MAGSVPFDSATLPAGIRSRFVDGINGLTLHVLEAGYESGRQAGRAPAARISGTRLQLAQGDAAAGGRRLSRDRAGPARLRPHHGLGRRPTTAISARSASSIWCAMRWGSVSALGLRSVAAVVGHDFGSPVAAWCALLRPDVFRSVVLMSAPFGGPPQLPFDTAGRAAAPRASGPSIHEALAALDPPRKHYHWYYSTREADADMRHCRAGHPCLPARLLPPQERRLDAQPAVSAGGLDGGGAGEAADLLRDGARQDHGRDGGVRDAVALPRSPRADG